MFKNYRSIGLCNMENDQAVILEHLVIINVQLMFQCKRKCSFANLNFANICTDGVGVVHNLGAVLMLINLLDA